MCKGPLDYPDAVHEDESGPEQSEAEAMRSRVRLALENGLQTATSLGHFYRIVKSALENY